MFTSNSASARKTILLLEIECIWNKPTPNTGRRPIFKEYVSKKIEAIFRIKEQSSGNEQKLLFRFQLKFDHNERFKLFFVSVRRKKTNNTWI